MTEMLRSLRTRPVLPELCGWSDGEVKYHRIDSWALGGELGEGLRRGAEPPVGPPVPKTAALLGHFPRDIASPLIGFPRPRLILR